MPKNQSRWSTDDVLIPVRIAIPQGANPDTTLDVVQFQFVFGGLPPRSQPLDGGWLDGFWLSAQQELLAGVTVGPDGGAITLTPGPWAIWIRIVDDPTVPVAPVDVLTIT